MPRDEDAVLDFNKLRACPPKLLAVSIAAWHESNVIENVLVMRDTTERPEGVEAGTLRLVGTDEEVIYKNFTELLTEKSSYEKMAKAVNPYGDGHSAERIVDILQL